MLTHNQAQSMHKGSPKIISGILVVIVCVISVILISLVDLRTTINSLTIELMSDQERSFRLYYDTGSGYNEQESVDGKVLRRDEQAITYHFPIPNDKTLIAIRIDPDEQPAQYFIKTVSLNYLYNSKRVYPHLTWNAGQIEKLFVPLHNVKPFILQHGYLLVETEGLDPHFGTKENLSETWARLRNERHPFMLQLKIGGYLLLALVAILFFFYQYVSTRLKKVSHLLSKAVIFGFIITVGLSFFILSGIYPQSFRILFTALFFLFLLATCWLLAHRMGRRNLLLSGPLALAILICFQTVLLNILSLFGAVSALSLLSGNMIFILTIICAEIHRLGTKGVLLEYGALIKCQADLWSGRSNPLALLVAPILLILFCTALVYPPNTWDSMTYHMARVVYWIENGSVAYFPTAIERQNLMNPGAEYVILLLQLLSASDFLANLVQFISYYILISAMPSFLRLLGIHRRIANWGLILAASLPMGVLQATSTQNDLVASCLGLALCVAALRLWHKTIRAKRSCLDIMVLALLGAVSYLVKVTAIVASAPFLLMAAMSYGIALIRRPQLWQRQAINLLLGVLLVAVVSGPDLYRKKEHTGSFTAARQEVFPFNGYRKEKVINSVVGINFHVIPTEAFYENIVKPLIDFFNCRPFPQPGEPFRSHEDLAGNPLHMIFAGVAILLFLLRFPWIPRPARWSVLFVCVSWILLHATIRYQPWISRLQTPVFMLFPCFLAAWSPSSKVRLARFFFAAILIVITMACLSYGIMTAVRNESRPLTLMNFWRLDRDSAYYVNRGLKPQHDAFIETVKRLKVKKVVLAIGGDDYDYPLSWRLYRLGIEVRHVTSDLAWADVVYSPEPLSFRIWADKMMADVVYAPEHRHGVIKDWPVDGSALINPRLMK